MKTTPKIILPMTKILKEIKALFSKLKIEIYPYVRPRKDLT